MHNPQSAIERIKNSLSYKLGSAILEHKKQYGRGFLILIYKLYKIKKQHFRDQKLYKQVTKIFPQLAYPKLETCSDYNESIRYKYHLSYMLGEVLIHAHKTWHKGGYFKLYKNIQIIKRQYNLLKELSLNNIDISLENKELLINNFEAIKDILQTHKDYKPILENIFHNFKFFLVNLTLIKEWLLSDDFYQRYKKENHPYPSLLDPKKLNNDSEEINYKNIPAELAWEMNLPLPDKYNVIYFHDSASGHLAMERLFFECNVRLISYYLDPDIKITYENIYNQYKLYQNLEVYINLEIKKHKFLDFIQGDIIIYVTRDPISRLKTHINHIYPKDEFLVNITLEDDPSKILNCTCFLNNSSNISVEFLDVFLKEKKDTVFMINNHYVDFLNSHNIFFMDMKDIDCDNAFDTMCMLSKKFHFKAPSLSSLTVFKTRMTGVFDFILPKILCINLDDVNVRIIITTLNRTVGDFLDVTKEFIYDTLEYKNLVLYMTREDYKILKQYNDIFKKCQEYLHDFIRKLIIKVNYEQSKKIDEIQILKYLRANNELKVLLKNILDQELIYIKNHRPDIVASWKYYQEFEKICRE